LSNSMLVQANDCKKVQCRPIDPAKARAIRSLGNR
jgi:hypothetical protein